MDLAGLIQGIWDAFLNSLKELATWLLDLVVWIPKKVFHTIMGELAELITSIPVPGFVHDAQGAFSSIPGEVLWFADAFEIDYGVPVIVSAYVLRFVIRRLPVVG